MIAAASLAVALAVPAAPADDRGAWVGAWKSADPTVYATIVIRDADASGFTLEWDENVGINGGRAEGRAALRADGSARFEGERCAMTLRRAEGDRLRAELDEDSCFLWSSHDALELVREDVTVHERTSFDCARAASPVERAVCADRDLAEADRLLAEAYAAAAERHVGKGPAASQRAWIAQRDRECGPAKEARACLLRAYGRRVLALRAWPEAPFDGGGRPRVAVLARVLAKDTAASGLRQLTAGLVGGIPADMDLRPVAEPAGLAFSGCDEPDPSRGFDPSGRQCGRTHYVAFLRDGATWAAWADADGVTIEPRPKRGQALPKSLQAYREDPWPPEDDD